MEFSGGVNTGLSIFDIGENQSPDEFGWDTDNHAVLTTAQARTAFGASGSAVTNLLTAYKQTQPFRAVGTALQYHNGTAWTGISGTFTNTDWSATNFNDKLLLVNGTDNNKKWDGSSLSDLSADSPKGKYITSSPSRVYIAHGDSIAFCAFQDETDWTSEENSGEDQFYTPTGGDVTALTFFADQVTAFKKDAMAVYYGNDYFTQKLVIVSNSIGCVSHKTVTEVNGRLFWLGRDDVYMYAGGAPVPIGQRIRSYLNSINTAHIAKCCAFTDGNRYYLCLVTGSATEPNTRLVYDPRYDIWRVPGVNENYRYATRFNGVTYVGDASGQTYQINTGNGSGAASITTKPYDLGIPEAEKIAMDLHIQGYFPSGTTVTVAIASDDRSSTFTTVAFDSSASAAISQNRNMIVPLDSIAPANWYRFKITTSGYAEIQQMQLYYRTSAVQS